jgi:radical SAM family uncharacterized protein
MNKKQIERSVLPLVKNPITYQGNEVGAVHKTVEAGTIRYAFAFPDTYAVGMSHLGLRILYGLMNEIADVYCERVFAPWIDMEEQMRDRRIPLFALETWDPIAEFDFVGFTLQYEMSYTNVLNMLDLAGIPLKSADRGPEDPIIMAGGPCACNPEPLADFIDVFVIGEAEEAIVEIMDVYRNNRGDRTQAIAAMAAIQGVYVPALCEAAYNADGTFEALRWKDSGEAVHIKKRFVADLEKVYFPQQTIVPYHETIHDRITEEIFRGCGRGCRFCQAGMIYRPVREKTRGCIAGDIAALKASTGYDEVSLSSLSTGDYSQIEGLTQDLVKAYADERFGISLPSLRIDSLSIDILKNISAVRKSGITLAPEAGTQRMRDIINKGVTEEDLIGTVTAAFTGGWGHVKLYFMMGLPGEETEDVLGIAALAQKVLDAYYAIPKEERNKSIKVVVSTACFVPKPHTPFQWVAQDRVDNFAQKQQLLKGTLTNRKIQYNWHDATTSYYEAVFARGDRRLGKVLLRAHQLGARFDGWQDCFDQERWDQAFADSGIDGDFYANRVRPLDEDFPWDFVDMGVSKDFLRAEYQKSQEEALTVDCRKGCSNCGIMDFSKGWRCHGNNAL